MKYHISTGIWAGAHMQKAKLVVPGGASVAREDSMLREEKDKERRQAEAEEKQRKEKEAAMLREDPTDGLRTYIAEQIAGAIAASTGGRANMQTEGDNAPPLATFVDQLTSHVANAATAAAAAPARIEPLPCSPMKGPAPATPQQEAQKRNRHRCRWPMSCPHCCTHPQTPRWRNFPRGRSGAVA